MPKLLTAGGEGRREEREEEEGEGKVAPPPLSQIPGSAPGFRVIVCEHVNSKSRGRIPMKFL